MRARESFSSGPIYVIRQALRLNEVAAGRKVLARKIPQKVNHPILPYSYTGQRIKTIDQRPWLIGATDVVRTFRRSPILGPRILLWELSA